MESSLLTADYLLTCFITIVVVAGGIFAPQSMEKDMPADYTADDKSKFHCRLFGWSAFVGAIGLLVGSLFNWNTLAMVIAFEVLAFGAAYFIGLLAFEHDKENFARRCSAVCNRYREALGAIFGERDASGAKKAADFEFLKKVEAHADTAPDKVVAMRIRHRQTFLAAGSCTGEIESMVEAYVRAGGRA